MVFSSDAMRCKSFALIFTWLLLLEISPAVALTPVMSSVICVAA
ncbi:MAG: hypothetical protein P8X96_08075 [Desulfobacteraceae bacterium]|jgi:hypothetical protein